VLKLWTGWSSFPMVFANGVLVGAADDLVKLMNGGEFQKIIASPQN